MQVDPPKRDCKLPSLNSFLNIDNVELEPPLRNLLLRWTWSKVKEKHDIFIVLQKYMTKQ